MPRNSYQLACRHYVYAMLSSMETLVGREIGPNAMEQIRTRAVRLVQQGHSPEDVIATLGFSRAFGPQWEQ